MTFSCYEDACAATVSKAEAEIEIGKHQVDGGFEQFLIDVGDKAEYEGSEVLDWLGY